MYDAPTDFLEKQSLHAFYHADLWTASYAGKKVLVTGAGGFIPSHLVEALVLADAHVTALVKYNGASDIGNLRYLPDALRQDINIVFGDVTDAFMMHRLVKAQDMVFHLAALMGIPYSYLAPQHYVNTNIQGTLNILEACRDKDIPVVQTSTSETYGTAIYTPIDEKHPLQGQSPYSATKIGADKLAESYFRSFETPVSVIRPFNTFGPRQSARAFIPTVIQQVLFSDAVRVGNLDPQRDLSPVWDTVRGFLAVGANPVSRGEVINIGNGKTQSMGDVLQQILRLTDKEGLPVLANEAVRMRPEKSEVQVLLGDTSKAKTLLGWEPKLTLEEGLKQAIAFSQAYPSHQGTAGYAV
jgi:NAD dependent epimerase/dehydratase